MSKEYRNHNNFIVEGSHQAVVNTIDIMTENYDMLQEIYDRNEKITINGSHYWLTTVESAINNGFSCYAFNRVILNSWIKA